MDNLEFKIFEDEGGTYLMAARKIGKKIKILYEGDDIEEMYTSILGELGYKIPTGERNMVKDNTCYYKPTLKDFEEE